MENNYEMLTGSSIEKAKALFEYEMTSVLLAFSEEQEAAQEELRKRYARYAEMEIEKPQVGFETPEFTPETVSAPPESISAVPEMSLPEVKAEISGIPQPGKTGPFAAPAMPGAPELPSAFLPESAVRTEGFSLPDITGRRQPAGFPAVPFPETGLSSGGLAGAGETDFVPVMPDIPGIPEIPVPAFGGNTVTVSNKAALTAPEMPPAPEKIAVPGVGKTAEVSRPEIALPEMNGVCIGDIRNETSRAKIVTGLPDTEPAAGVSFSKPENVISAGAFSQAEMPSGIEPPGGILPEITVSADIIETVSVKGPSAAFTPAEPEPVRVEVSYVQPVPVRFETAGSTKIKMTAPEYPEIPDKPDMSAALDEILEAARAEI